MLLRAVLQKRRREVQGRRCGAAVATECRHVTDHSVSSQRDGRGENKSKRRWKMNRQVGFRLCVCPSVPHPSSTPRRLWADAQEAQGDEGRLQKSAGVDQTLWAPGFHSPRLSSIEEEESSDPLGNTILFTCLLIAKAEQPNRRQLESDAGTQCHS